MSVRLMRPRWSHSDLGALLQRLPVGDGDAGAARRGSSLRVLELLHRARDRLAARADHLGDRLVRERLLDRRRCWTRPRGRAAAARCGPGTSSSTSPPIFSSARRRRRESSVSSAQATAGLASTRRRKSSRRRMSSCDVLHRDDVRRAGLVVDQRQLAEVVAGLEHAEDHLAAVLADEDDLHAALRST